MAAATHASSAASRGGKAVHAFGIQIGSVGASGRTGKPAMLKLRARLRPANLIPPPLSLS